MTAAFVTPDEVEAWAGAEDPDNYQIIALDPGGTTGWALFQVHPDAMTGDPDITVMSNIEWWTAGEFTGSSLSQCDEVVELCVSWPGARLVTEDFKLRQMAAELDPVEINHTVAWALRPRYFVKQSAALAMGTVTDDRQKAWGFWIPGKPHARDAVKHAITFLKRKKQQAVVEAERARRLGGGA
jgi:hypothetical protein